MQSLEQAESLPDQADLACFLWGIPMSFTFGLHNFYSSMHLLSRRQFSQRGQRPWARQWMMGLTLPWQDSCMLIIQATGQDSCVPSQICLGVLKVPCEPYVMYHAEVVQATCAINNIIISSVPVFRVIVVRSWESSSQPSHRWNASTASSRRGRRILRHCVFIVASLVNTVCFQYKISKLHKEENRREILAGETPVVGTALAACPGGPGRPGCQRKATYPAPSADPLKLQGCSAAFRLWGTKRGAQEKRETTQGDCRSFTKWSWRTSATRNQGSCACCRGTFHCPTVWVLIKLNSVHRDLRPYWTWRLNIAPVDLVERTQCFHIRNHEFPCKFRYMIL